LVTAARGFGGVVEGFSRYGRASAGSAGTGRFLRTMTVGFLGATDFDGMIISLSVRIGRARMVSFLYLLGIRQMQG
jgi:hypothetical protein